MKTATRYDFNTLTSEERMLRFKQCDAERRTIVEKNGLQYTPISLPKDFELGSDFDVIFGHFESEELNLKGDLRKPHSDPRRRLCSDVWNLARDVTIWEHFDACVVLVNMRC